MIKDFAKKDFSFVLKKLRQMGVTKNLSCQNETKLRKIHYVVYSFAVWVDKIADVFDEEHRIIFLADLKSDMVQLMPLLMCGYKKATAMLLRSSIENILKHVFFFDHRVEFERCKKNNFAIKQDELCSYLKNHPDIGKQILKVNGINILTSKYVELSEIVHGKRALKKDITECLESIKFEQKFYDECFRTILLLGNIYNFILATFHKSILNSFESTCREFLLGNLDKGTYKVFSTYK